MKKITLNNKKYDIPSSWDDITLTDQIRIADVAAKHTGLTSQLQLVAGYANIPIEVIKHLHISELPKLVKQLDFVKEPLETKPMESFEHKGHTYHIIPTLLNGEFQDFISLEAVMTNHKENIYEGLPMMIAILCKRENESLDDYDIEERSKEFMDLPIRIVNNISSFFLNIGISSQLSTPTYLGEMEKNLSQEVIKALDELILTTKQSGGQGLLGRLQKRMLRKYAQYLKKNFISSLTGTQSKS